MSPLILMPAALIAAQQVGPNPAPSAVGNAIDPAVRPAEYSAPPATDRLPTSLCRADDDADFAAIAQEAERRASAETGDARIAAIYCLAMAQVELEAWTAAADNFARARALLGGDPALQARIGAQRGHALNGAGEAAAAIEALSIALDDAATAGDAALAGIIAADRAIMQVASGDMTGAEATLAQARQTASQAMRIWLLSATLARRNGELVQAQDYIAQGERRGTPDAAFDLEAGVIAALQGQGEAARTRFQRVIEAERTGDLAAQARGYLDQLRIDPPPAE